MESRELIHRNLLPTFLKSSNQTVSKTCESYNVCPWEMWGWGHRNFVMWNYNLQSYCSITHTYTKQKVLQIVTHLMLTVGSIMSIIQENEAGWHRGRGGECGFHVAELHSVNLGIKPMCRCHTFTTLSELNTILPVIRDCRVN